MRQKPERPPCTLKNQEASTLLQIVYRFIFDLKIRYKLNNSIEFYKLVHRKFILYWIKICFPPIQDTILYLYLTKKLKKKQNFQLY
ncbi:hypothetical protein pb186bvf_009807 [Paramecium bursaria]